MKKIFLSFMLVGLVNLDFAQQSTLQDTAKKGQKQMARWNQMKTELHLSDQQIAELKTLHNQNKMETLEIRSEFKQKMKAQKVKHQEELKKILTPEQFAKMKAEKKQMKNAKKGTQRRNKKPIQQA